MIIKLIGLLILIILICVIYFIIFHVYFSIHPGTCECNKILFYNKPYVIKNVFTTQFCNEIIEEAIDRSKRIGWETNRHDLYATRDQELNDTWKNFKKIENIIINEIFKNYKEQYGVNRVNLVIKEVFIVKYDLENQKSLDLHKDGSEYSFVISLNNDFKGGGTYFLSENKTYKPDIGDCLIFSGKNKHSGVEITSGERYILTGFINIINMDFCEIYLNDLNSYTFLILLIILICLILINRI